MFLSIRKIRNQRYLYLLETVPGKKKGTHTNRIVKNLGNFDKLPEEVRNAVYKNEVLSFNKLCTTPNIAFGQITRDNLRRYGQYLYEHGLKPNTVSTYMRMLRSIYNRGVEAGIARFIPRLFRDVYTGVDVRQKKALPAGELHTSHRNTDISSCKYRSIIYTITNKR